MVKKSIKLKEINHSTSFNPVAICFSFLIVFMCKITLKIKILYTFNGKSVITFNKKSVKLFKGGLHSATS